MKYEIWINLLPIDDVYNIFWKPFQMMKIIMLKQNLSNSTLKEAMLIKEELVLLKLLFIMEL